MKIQIIKEDLDKDLENLRKKNQTNLGNEKSL
jgi:hypothetical protein